MDEIEGCSVDGISNLLCMMAQIVVEEPPKMSMRKESSGGGD